jgi:acetyltransferase-like isoleucine patch superfamily enzyme
MIGPNVTILDSPFHPIWPTALRGDYPGVELDRPVEIGEDVWIGAQVIVLPGARIGSGSAIGAGSVVRGEIPVNCLAAGAPARVIRRLDSDTALTKAP